MSEPSRYTPRRHPFVSGTLLLLLLASTSLAAQSVDEPPRIADGVGSGSARLRPASFEVAAVGSYDLELTVGAGGIATGGGLLVDFPKAWFANPFPSVKTVQTSNVESPHHVGAAASRPGVGLRLRLLRQSRTGQSERFRHVFWVTVTDGTLEPGDLVTLSFANTTAPVVAEQNSVAVAVDPDGSGAYRPLEHGADYEALAGAGVEVRLLAPSQGIVGRRLELQLTALDRFFNVAEDFAGILRIGGLEEKPITAEFGTTENGILRVDWTPSEAGWHFPTARGTILINKLGNFAPMQVEVHGGPIRVFDREPELKVYWGDLHSHSAISKDGIGHGAFAYARDTSRLDFFAATEHADDDGYISGRPNGDDITPEEWQQLVDDVRSFYAPGRFVTLLAYECSLPQGHHNVYFRGLDGVPYPAYAVRDVERLWSLLQRGQAFTVPHHLGIGWGAPIERSAPGPELQEIFPADPDRVLAAPRLDWSAPHDHELRPLLEIYSAHGQSELYAPRDPLAYESVAFTNAASGDGPHYARDAWEAGVEIGAIAASDDHTARPGQHHYGLTAVHAPALEREAIFDALLSRRAYATTGERIYLDFSIAGAPMGSRVEIDGPAEGRVEVAAPTPIRFAEVLGWDAEEKEWFIAASWAMPGRQILSGFLDVPDEPTVYFLRVELDRETGGRTARAWSSPIWVIPPPPPATE